jgi:hypothetical protein
MPVDLYLAKQNLEQQQVLLEFNEAVHGLVAPSALFKAVIALVLLVQ